jgi:hypothetical protein
MVSEVKLCKWQVNFKNGNFVSDNTSIIESMADPVLVEVAVPNGNNNLQIIGPTLLNMSGNLTDN